MITKETTSKIIDFLKLRVEFDSRTQEMMEEVSLMFEEVRPRIDKFGVIRLEVNVIEDKIVFGYMSYKTNKKVEFYESKGFDIMWDAASWHIAKTEIKDVLYDVRRSMREKAEAKAREPLTLWEKIKDFFKNA
jgi:hypothetical protein